MWEDCAGDYWIFGHSLIAVHPYFYLESKKFRNGISHVVIPAEWL